MSFETWVILLGPNVRVEGNYPNRNVSSVSIDTRTLQPGDIYFAINGDNFDGHNFINPAFEAGAIACVAREGWEPDWKISDQNIIVRCDEPLESLQVLAKNYRRKFSIPVLGLTGTNGKTTTKEMIAAVLGSKYQVTKTIGNLNNHIGTPLSLLQIDKNTDIAIIEMGMNHAGEIARLCEFAAPDFGLITNIGAGHLGYFSDIEEIAQAKGELFHALPERGTAFVNADDPRVVRESEIVKHKITYGFSTETDIFGTDLETDHNGFGKFKLQNRVHVQLHVPGRHQLHNALAACAVGMHFGISEFDIAEALTQFTCISKRLELIEFGSSLVILDAYNSNPDSLIPAFETLSYLAHRRKGRALAVLGDMLELGNQSKIEHESAGKTAVEHGIEALFLFGPESKYTLESFKEAGEKTAFHFDDKRELASYVSKILRENDVLLIKGSRGMQMEEVWQELQNLDETLRS